VRLTKYGHSCLLVEQADARLLIDPGSLSRGFEELRDLSAVLITHQHPDHVDLDRIEGLLRHNAAADVFSDRATAEQLRARGLPARAVRSGEDLVVSGARVQVVGDQHAVIHADIPRIDNVGYLIADRLLHPGDSLTVPNRPVDVLCLPTAAPWLKAAEAVDYLRSVGPRVALPIHEAQLALPQLYYGLFEQLAPPGTELRVIDGGEPTEL